MSELKWGMKLYTHFLDISAPQWREVELFFKWFNSVQKFGVRIFLYIYIYIHIYYHQHEYLKLIKSDIKDDEIMRGFSSNQFSSFHQRIPEGEKNQFPQRKLIQQLFSILMLIINQQFRMISEGSCDTEDCSKFSFVITGINYILKYIPIENSYFKL